MRTRSRIPRRRAASRRRAKVLTPFQAYLDRFRELYRLMAIASKADPKTAVAIEARMDQEFAAAKATALAFPLGDGTDCSGHGGRFTARALVLGGKEPEIEIRHERDGDRIVLSRAQLCRLVGWLAQIGFLGELRMPWQPASRTKRAALHPS